MLKLILTGLLIVIPYLGFTQLLFNLKFQKDSLVTFEDFFLTLEFKAGKQGQKYLVPRFPLLVFNKAKRDFNGSQMIVTLQKIEGTGHRTIENLPSSHSVLYFPYYNIPENEKYDTVAFTKNVTDKINLWVYYGFSKGKYRVRLKCISEKGKRTKPIYSKWLYFFLPQDGLGLSNETLLGAGCVKN
jgi:hypothetical protein